MAIDYRLANEVLNRKADYSLGDKVVEGGKIIRDSFDRSRELDRRAEMDRIGAFISDEIKSGEPSENAIIAEVAKTMPTEAMTMFNNLQNRYQKEDQAYDKLAFEEQEAENAANAQMQKTNLLGTAYKNKIEAGNIMKDIRSLKNKKNTFPRGTSQYNQFETDKQNQLNLYTDSYNKLRDDSSLFNTAMSGQQGFSKMYDTTMIQDLETASMKYDETKLANQGKKLTNNEIIRKRDDGHSKILRDVQDKYLSASKELGYNHIDLNRIDRNLDTLKRMAKGGFKEIDKNGVTTIAKPNPAAIHALNIMATKSLDGESAVLLSEASALGSQTLKAAVEKYGSYLTGKESVINVDDTFKMAKKINEDRKVSANALSELYYKKAKDASKRFINKSIKPSRYQYGLPDFDAL